ncbi:MAG: dTMP kinase [Candidatus Bathyarchaeia archaeon]|jgi:dTMP kinase|nr:dTMP kinase [Candidatus Bathyarchaeota archaeon A05DMB-4]MDH7595271.1 dTMP kinase [Candidatus Bathyarchaeota archaeon]
MKKHGVFICIEGLDASGKTTQSKLLVKNLRKRGFNAVYTTEPSKGQVGRLIRRHVLYGKNRSSAVLEALLFAADRISHIENEVKPLLDEGKIVVSDRYLYSSLAYQGATGLELKWIEEINRWAKKPDLAIYIDIPPEIVLRRLKRKKSVMENLKNQKNVREIYLKLVKTGVLKLVEGNKPKKAVAKEILNMVTNLLSGPGI